jgi:immune inhibitor A
LPGTYLSGTAQVALTTNTNPNASSAWEGNGITGSSSNVWRLASFNLTPYAGQTVLLALRYRTDEFTSLKGVMADEISIGNFADGAESGDNGWTMSGFKVTTGVESSNLPHYYIAEYRQYRTYDEGLKTGPYTFGYAALPNYVAHYPYQDGLLITYWDTGMEDNDITNHRGEGRSLPIDAHPVPLLRNVQFPGQAPSTSPWSSTVQVYDAPFGLQPTDAFTLPFVGVFNGQRLQFQEYIPSLPAATRFDDTNDYWFASKPDSSVIVPKTGTSIRVVNTSTQGDFMQVHVSHK